MDEEQTAEVVQDPAPPDTPTAPTNPGPWSQDLDTRFADPEVRGQVDTYLREVWQPRVTQIEQQIAGLKPAEQLYADLVENPADTFLTLGEELFGEDGAKAIEQQLTTLFGEQEDTDVTDPSDTPPSINPEDQAAIEWAKQQAVQQQYNAEFERVKGLDEYKDIPTEDWELFHPFVASAEGDFDTAAAGFNQWRSQVESRYKPAEDPPAPDPEAPVTLDATTPAAPPVQKDYTGPGGLDRAVDDFFAETRPQAPPVVGSV